MWEAHVRWRGPLSGCLSPAPLPGPWAAKRISGKVAKSQNPRIFSDNLLSCTLSRKVLLCAPTRGRFTGVCFCSSCQSLTGFPATWVNLQVRHWPTPRASPAGTERDRGSLHQRRSTRRRRVLRLVWKMNFGHCLAAQQYPLCVSCDVRATLVPGALVS